MSVDEKERTISVSFPEPLVAKILRQAEEGQDPEAHLRAYIRAAVHGRFETDEEVKEYWRFHKLSAEEQEAYLSTHPQYLNRFR